MKLRAINVGQWDSFVLSDFEERCDFSLRGIGGIIVDVWSGWIPIDGHLDLKKSHILCLTHSHKDHVWGLPKLIEKRSGKSALKIREIWLPYNANEIHRVLNFVQKEKVGTTYENSDIDDVLAVLEKLSGRRCVWVYEGKKMSCQHIRFLNPPRILFTKKGVQNAKEVCELLGLNYEGEVLDIIENPSVVYRIYDSGGVNLDALLNGWSHSSSTGLLRYGHWNEADYRWRSAFLHLFLYAIRKEFIAHSKSKTSEKYDELCKCVFEKINNQSIVFSYKNDFSDRNDLLMSWDAEIPVFERLLNKDPDCLSSRILKVPHHGSDGAMNASILKGIDPVIWIIPHNNRSFKSWRYHPHDQVLDALENQGVFHFHTNVIHPPRTTAYRKYFPPTPPRRDSFPGGITTDCSSDKIDFDF